VKILLVCTGNICRSPTAEGVLRHMVERAGLADRVTIDSAGTHGYHVGEPPDVRSQAHALKRGYDLSALRASRVSMSDFERYDWILAMDRGHYQLLKRSCPPRHHAKLKLFLSFAPELGIDEVPDPYYGGPDGFDQVLDLIEAAARTVVSELKRELSGPLNSR
jgi:protein-tyrosine phosphatase